MAGRFFGSSAASIAMIVTNTPSQELALTNLAYISASDLPKFAVPGHSNLYLASIGDVFVFSLSAHESIRGGHIALNSIQRRCAKVSAAESVDVTRFVPPENFNLAMLTVELDFIKRVGNRNEQIDAIVLAKQLRRRLNNQVMTAGQKVLFEFQGNNYSFTVREATVEGRGKSNSIERGLILDDTFFVFDAPRDSGIKIINQREGTTSNIFKQKEFNLESLGIGGLGAEFADIFRRAFASRVFPPHVTSKLGIKHVKGMLLYGPPGTGKTLMARQIGKILNGKDPKIVNGPEVLSKFVGETEKNVRDLFADAEQDQRTLGDESDLHVIIFDEIDAICKSRGSTKDGTGVHDSIVNQLLTKIDGVESLNNVLLIGMTNRKDMLDEALLRPGRLEVQVEISLPDENGRLQILQIHTNKMKENSFLAADVNLQELAARTKNYSGAELEGVVKSAVSYALNRQLSLEDLTKPVEEENIKVTMDDFLNALHEVIPAFGASTDDLERCRLHGMVECGDRHKHIYQRAMLVAEQVKVSKGSPLVTCLLEGYRGSGKTALAATIGIDSDFAYVKIISAETMIGLHESSKCAQIIKVFEDAYKSPLSVIVLDDIERLLEYVPIGPRFSNLISQTLLVLLKKLPPKIQGGATADSTTSEASSEAIRLSCNILVERLKPIKKKLQEEKSSIKWEDLTLQAYTQAVNLSASSYFVPSNNSVNYLNYGAAVSEVEIDLLTGETRCLQIDIIYDCGQSLNPAVDLGQIEGSFMQGLGFFMLEEYETNLDGLVLKDGTWNYKIPTIDTIPQQLNVEIVNSDHHKHRVLSSKASGEPPLLLAASVHCATRSPVKQAWKQLHSWSNFDESDSTLPLGVPATMPVVKELIGLDIVERHLKWKMDNE